MITIEDIKEQYLKGVLDKTGFEFVVYNDIGQFAQDLRSGNTVKNRLNAILTVTGSELQRISGVNGALAVAISAGLEILIPCDDVADYNGNYARVNDLRERLNEAFSLVDTVTLVDKDKDENYIGGASFVLPTVGQLAIRQELGSSISYHCGFSIAYLQNGVNSSDVVIEVKESIGTYTPIPFMNFSISANAAVSADIMARNNMQETSGYAESVGFKIDLTVPLLKGPSGTARFLPYILGTKNINDSMRIRVKIDNTDLEEKEITTERDMIVCGGDVTGAGVTNATMRLTLVPYTTEETVGG